MRIVLYGNLIHIPSDEGGLEIRDSMPSLVNKIGTVQKIVGDKFPKYYLLGVAKYGPYNAEQIEKV